MGGRYVWVGKGYLGRRLEPTQVSGSDCKTRKGGKSQPVWGQIMLDSLKKKIRLGGLALMLLQGELSRSQVLGAALRRAGAAWAQPGGSVSPCLLSRPRQSSALVVGGQ